MQEFYFSRRECMESFVSCISDTMMYDVVECKSGWFEYWVVLVYGCGFVVI